MLDKLNRLEKLGYIQNATAWQNIRITRNKFTHDYPNDWNRNATLINVACEAAAKMHSILTRIEKKLKTEHLTLDLGNALTAVYPKQS